MSIYDAAAIIAFKVQAEGLLTPVDVIKGTLQAIGGRGIKVTINDKEVDLVTHLYCEDLHPGSHRYHRIKIWIRPEAFEGDPHAHLHLEKLLEVLNSDGIECHWVNCPNPENDRSCSIYYTITPHWADLKINDNRHRWQILCAAAAAGGVDRPTHLWHSDEMNSDGDAKGKVHFESPNDADAVRKLGSRTYRPFGSQGMAYDIGFHGIDFYFPVKSCTTIASAFVDPKDRDEEHEYDEEAWSDTAQLGLSAYNRSVPASFKARLHFMLVLVQAEDRYQGYILSYEYARHDGVEYFMCTVSHIAAAWAMCEYPLPDGGFFRPVFRINDSQWNVFLKGRKEYCQRKQQDYDTRVVANCSTGQTTLWSTEPPPPKTFDAAKKYDTTRRARTDEPPSRGSGGIEISEKSLLRTRRDVLWRKVQWESAEDQRVALLDKIAQLNRGMGVDNNAWVELKQRLSKLDKRMVKAWNNTGEQKSFEQERNLLVAKIQALSASAQGECVLSPSVQRNAATSPPQNSHSPNVDTVHGASRLKAQDGATQDIENPNVAPLPKKRKSDPRGPAEARDPRPSKRQSGAGLGISV